LDKALRKGEEPLIQCAERTAEVALKAVKISICEMAAKEKWTEECRDQQLKGMWEPVQELLKQVTLGRRAAAIANWTREVHYDSVRCK
jgi:hypothetical protein